MKKLAIAITALSALQTVQAEVRPLPPVINNSTYMDGSQYVSTRTPSNKPMLNMLSRIESLQAEIQQLRGLVEQQSHEMKNLMRREQNMYKDINDRFQALESVATVPSSVDVNYAKKPKIKLGENLAIPLAERQNQQRLEESVRLQAERVANNNKPATAKPNEKSAFERAYKDIRQGRYPEAIKLFKQFLAKYPDGQYSDNALFWLGSAYKVTGQFKPAKQAYNQVLTQFPASEKAASALLKLADISLDEQKKKQAINLYKKITVQYAQTSAAHIAEKQLKALGQ